MRSRTRHELVVKIPTLAKTGLGWGTRSIPGDPISRSPDHPITRSPDHPISLLSLHGLDHLKELFAVGDFHERPLRVAAADHVDGRRVLDSYFAA